VNRESRNPSGKPVLDQATFQQLLAAAYTLQQQTIHLPVGKMADSPPALSAGAAAQKIQPVPLVSLAPRSFAEIKRREDFLPRPVDLETTNRLSVMPGISLAQSGPEPSASNHDSPLQLEADTRLSRRPHEVLWVARLKPRQSKSTELLLPEHPVPSGIWSSRYRKVPLRVSPGNELFWRAATVGVIAAFLGLLLSASIDRFSPLPAGLTLPADAFSEQPPFGKAKPALTVAPQSDPADTETVALEPVAGAKTEPNQATVIAGQPPEVRATLASEPRTMANPNRARSAYEDEADVVAPDTVVRYGVRSAAPRLRALRAQKSP
jgi:hypothetical protein